MEQDQPFEKDLASIHQLMERSVKFISLSGAAGILTGVYALLGAGMAYVRIHNPESPFYYPVASMQAPRAMFELSMIGTVVLVLSLTTLFLMSNKKAKKLGASIWDETGRRLMINLAIPLFTGGAFVLILLASNHFGLAAPVCLIFYGLALVNASPNLYDEYRYLGYLEIVLGLLGALMPGYGLLAWAIGFGVLHVVYGTLMYRRYEA